MVDSTPESVTVPFVLMLVTGGPRVRPDAVWRLKETVTVAWPDDAVMLQLLPFVLSQPVQDER